MTSDFNKRFSDAAEEMKREHEEKVESRTEQSFGLIKRSIQIVENCVFNLKRKIK